MERGKISERAHVLAAVSTIIFIFLQLLLSVPVQAEDDIAVNCYVKSDGGYVFIDDVNVFDTSQAASACNAMYVGCRGQCVGCIDSEGEKYCYDNSGNRFPMNGD